MTASIATSLRRFALWFSQPEGMRLLPWVLYAAAVVALLTWDFRAGKAEDYTKRNDQLALEASQAAASLSEEVNRLYLLSMEPPPMWREHQGDLSKVRFAIEADTETLGLRVKAQSAGERRDASERQYRVIREQVTKFADDVARFLDERPRGESPQRFREWARTRVGEFRLQHHEIARQLKELRKTLVTPEAANSSNWTPLWSRRVTTAALVMLGLTALGAGCFVLLRHFQWRDTLRAENARLSDRSRSAEARFQSIFDHAVEGIFHAAPDGRFVGANRALAKMYGYQSPEHLMSSLRDVFSQLYVEPEERPALLEALQQTDVLSNFEMEVVRADGRAMWIRENIRAVRDETGEVLFLEGTVEDVSDRWWSEQRRRLQYATARVLDKASSVAEARPMILQTICEILDWDMGAVWNVNGPGELLHCGEVWHSPDVDIAEFEEAVSKLAYAPGQGLVGEVWESGEPKWIANLIDDARTVGARIAINHGMGSAFCVPIKVRGEVRHVVEFFSPKISLPDPELLQTLGVVANQLGHLIERKGAEEALKTSEMRKAAILGSALDCIISFDLDGQVLEFNPAAERAFGLSAKAAVGVDVTTLIAPDELHSAHRPGIALFTAGSLSMNSGQRVEMLARRSNGDTFPVEASISRINLDGPPIFTAFLRDISVRRKAERLISELAAVVANSNDAIVGCTLDGTIRSWNAGAERIYGWSADEAIGQSLGMLLPEDRGGELAETLSTVECGDSLTNYQSVHLRKDGRKISVSVTDSPVRSERGDITGLSSIARDITERKRLEEDLLQSQKMDAVGRLAGGIAHDFNNILTAILGYSDLIIGRTKESEWMYKHLTEIRKAADFAASLTHQLLAFSRRQPLFLRVFCINDTVHSMHKMLQRVIGEQVKIRTEMDAEIGRLKADPSQLEQVLLNLCVNARDAMPQGGEIVIYTSDICYAPGDEPIVNEMPPGDYVRLTVADSGTGIPPQVLKHIFEPFFTTKDEGHGTGLGLATCYGIVKQSGGYISVESTLGEGTKFCIFFPAVTEAEGKDSARPDNEELPGGTETILYVEDEINVRRLTAHVLRDLGYTVLEAGDGDEARSILDGPDADEIDLLFSDVVLPDLSGRELADIMIAQNRGTKLLFTSGYMDDVMLRRHGIEESAAFLQKPFSPADVAHKVREVMDSADDVLALPSGSQVPEATR